MILIVGALLGGFLQSVLCQVHPQFGHVALCDQAGGLAAIHEPSINLVIWRRQIKPELVFSIDQASYNELPAERSLINFHYNMRIDQTGWHELLRGEVEELTKVFRSYTNCGRASAVGYRDRGSICSSLRQGIAQKFHRDSVGSYRMLTTWRGPGTEWLPEQRHLKERWEGPNYFISRFPVQQLLRGEVMLMRGGVMGATIFHRSPRLAWGSLRLVTVFDPLRGIVV